MRFPNTLPAIALLAVAAPAFAAPGWLEVTFNGTGTVATAVASGGARATSVVLQSDGKIVAAGYASNGSNLDFALVRYDTAGMLDTTFGGTGIVTTPVATGGDDQAAAVIQQSDGKLVAAGMSFDSSFNSSVFTV